MSGDEEQFGGVIGPTYKESKPWWPDRQNAVGKPNVVIVLLDDVGFADFGCYGSEIDTPAFDGLAAGGVRLNNFHTTAICSPSRASLLTGRNPHSVGIGTVVDFGAASSGFPGYRGYLSKASPTLAEVLRDAGYATFMSGKWHLMPMEEATAAGPFDNWPLGRGFDRWFGFHGGLTDQWYPELFEDNHVVDLEPGPLRHLSERLVDFSIDVVRDHRAGSQRPFFLYLAFGAGHFPLQAPAENIEKYRGRYGEGWDALREQRFARQLELGIVPPGTQLPPRNPGVDAWDSLTDQQKMVYERLQETYAGFIDHTDSEVGRLVAYLKAIGELDNTIFVLTSDNGGSGDGGWTGGANSRRILDGTLDRQERMFAESLKLLDEMGGPNTYPHYSTGWAQASNTPLKWYKKQVHGGGIRDPLVISWPERIPDGGAIRTQYHFVADVMPTILELVDVADSLNGGAQSDPESASFAYALSADGADEPTRKSVQYYEQLGSRAIWQDGWKAVTRHFEGEDFDDDVWELYHVAEDYSESTDLAQAEPDRLAKLIDLWWAEARKYNVFPLDDRMQARKLIAAAERSRRLTVLHPGTARLDRTHTPSINDRSYDIRAYASLPDQSSAGVLLSVGSHFGGLVLYVADRRLIFEYVFDTIDKYTLVSDIEIPLEAPCELRMAFRRTGYRTGVASLAIDGREAGSVKLDETWPTSGLTAGLHVGRDGSTPVTDSYPFPFAFTGALDRIEIEVDESESADAGGDQRKLAHNGE
jgi:arylsulfatase